MIPLFSSCTNLICTKEGPILHPFKKLIMEYTKLISVTGLPGLFELIGNKGDGAIVRSLENKTTKFISGRLHNFSHLESIEIYTTHENVNLADVLKAMLAQPDVTLPDEKNPAAIKAYFEKVFPAMDFDRVYTSDMKKIVRWHKILSAAGIAIELKKEAGTETEPEVEIPTPAAEVEKTTEGK